MGHPVFRRYGPLPATIGSSIGLISSQIWLGVDNITTSDNSYATVSGDVSTDAEVFMCSGFGFGIPNSNLVSGILVEYEFHQDDASDVTDAGNGGIQLYQNKSPLGSPITSGAIPPNVNTIVPYGVPLIDVASPDGWDISTPIRGVDVNDPTFAVGFAPDFTSTVGIDQVFVDRVTMFIIHYPSGLDPNDSHEARTPVGDSSMFNSSIFNSNIF